jgi:hypothetical protein
MAIQGGLPVSHHAIFPNGAFVVGAVTALEDFEAAKAAKEAGIEMDVQLRDKDTDLRLWQVRVIDADERTTRKGQTEVVVKIAAEVQPVPPEALPGLPFRPVEFAGLVAIAYIDENKARPRLAWSLRASGMYAPGKAPRAGQPGQPQQGDGKAA